MTIQADAVYIGGSLQLKQPLPLAEGAEVRIAIQTEGGTSFEANSAFDPLAEVIGIGDGPASGDVAAKHDDHLYDMP
jgi:predicted DNA-binding antitoxin AbrB/MazE fold protein